MESTWRFQKMRLWENGIVLTSLLWILTKRTSADILLTKILRQETKICDLWTVN